MRLISAAAFVLLAAQPAAPTFEVASIRPLGAIRGGMPFSAGPQGSPVRITVNGRLQGRGQLRTLIHLAYSLQPYEKIVAAERGDASRLDEWFEVSALPFDAPSPPSRTDVLGMTRQMLAERFGLKLRVDTELVSASVLRVLTPGVHGPGLRPAPEGCVPVPAGVAFGDIRFAEAFVRGCVVTDFGGRLRGTVTLDDFAQMLSFRMQRPVLNRTGLEGPFAIDVNVALPSLIELVRSLAAVPVSTSNASPESDAPALVDAFRDQMGLSVGIERDQPIRRLVIEQIGPLVAN